MNKKYAELRAGHSLKTKWDSRLPSVISLSSVEKLCTGYVMGVPVSCKKKHFFFFPGRSQHMERKIEVKCMESQLKNNK